MKGRETFRAWTATIGTFRGLFLRWLLPLCLVPIACSLVERDVGVLLFSLLLTLWVGCLVALSVLQRVLGRTLVVGADGFRVDRVFGKTQQVAFRDLTSLDIEELILSWTAAGRTVHLYLEPCGLLKLFDAMTRSGITAKRTAPAFAPGYLTSAAIEARWEQFRARGPENPVATRFRVSAGEDTYRVAEVDEAELAELVTDPTLDVPTRLQAASRLVQMSETAGATAARAAADTTADAAFAKALRKLTAET